MAPDRDLRGRLIRTADPYAALADLAERGCALAQAGDLDGLAAAAEQAATLRATLPARPGAAAEASLRRAAAAQARTTALLAQARADAQGELGRLRAGRRLAGGYAAGAATAPAVDRAG